MSKRNKAVAKAVSGRVRELASSGRGGVLRVIAAALALYVYVGCLFNFFCVAFGSDMSWWGLGPLQAVFAGQMSKYDDSHSWIGPVVMGGIFYGIIGLFALQAVFTLLKFTPADEEERAAKVGASKSSEANGHA